MVDGLLRLALGTIYITKKKIALTELELLACLWQEINCVRYGVVGLVVLVK